jgi:thymidylate synthase
MKWWIEDMPSGYATICQDVVEQGMKVSPRGQLTHEILDPLIVVGDPTRALPVGTNRKLNSAIGAVEAAQLIGGVSYPELTVRVAPNMKQFMDDGRFYGAYGLRMGRQMQATIDKLKADPDTRQAVVTIWQPQDAEVQSKDMPCTLSFVFMIRGGKLQLHTTMRSNDVWWGLPYDIFQFTQLQLTVARCLGIEAGEYFHRPVSLHAYERDFENIAKLEYNYEHWNAQPILGFGNESDAPWSHYARTANRILTNDTWPHLTDSEGWYRERLAPYVG